MSAEVLKQVIERAINDEAFRHQLFSDPDAALQGYDLSAEDRALLSGLDEDNFDGFAGTLGDRTTKGRGSQGPNILEGVILLTYSRIPGSPSSPGIGYILWATAPGRRRRQDRHSFLRRGT
jgi:hypothetical protein